ncbi:MAG: RrF2 family transcriptional regulator [Nitrospiria bacterium]
MLKLTKKTDYALMAINYMAYRKDSFVANTRNIAETYNIPRELLAKILQKLAKDGFVESQNGPRGGYTLVKEPCDISLGEVIRAIEGPIQIVRCTEEGGAACLQTEQCTIQSPLRKIEREIVSYLDGITIDKLSGMSADEVLKVS